MRKFFDELCQDERLSCGETRFKVTVYLTTVDRVCSQLQQRFNDLNSVVSLFTLLSPPFLTTASDDALHDACQQLRNKYDCDLSAQFPSQMLLFRTCLRKELLTKSTVYEVAELLMVEHYALASSFGDVCAAYMLFLTIPVTVASCERSFSKLKIIKNYLRSTMSQERLSGLALLSIENERARMIDVANMIDIFSEQKARKKTL